MTTEALLEMWKNNPEEVRYLSGAQKRKLRKHLAILSGERVIPRCERRKRWYQVDGSLSEYVECKRDTDTQKNETAQLGSKEFGKIMKWIRSGKPLADTTNIMEMAVVLEGFPCTKMTKIQGDEIAVELSQRIKPTDSEPIQFDSTRFENGAMIFACANEVTKMWLRNTVPTLNLWPRVKLEVGPADIVVHGIKLIVWVKNLMKKRTTEQILDLMEKQNKNISTREWTVIERNDFSQNASLTMWIDNRSMNTLKTRDLKLHLGLGRVTFKPLLLLDKSKIETVSSETSEHQSAVGGLVPQSERKAPTEKSYGHSEAKHREREGMAQKVTVKTEIQDDSAGNTVQNSSQEAVKGNADDNQKPTDAPSSVQLSDSRYEIKNSQSTTSSKMAVVKPMSFTEGTSSTSDHCSHQKSETIDSGHPHTHKNSDNRELYESQAVVKNASQPKESQLGSDSSQQYRHSTSLSSRAHRLEFSRSQDRSRHERSVDSSLPKTGKSTFIRSSPPRFITVCPRRSDETTSSVVDTPESNKLNPENNSVVKSRDKRRSDTTWRRSPEKRFTTWNSHTRKYSERRASDHSTSLFGDRNNVESGSDRTSDTLQPLWTRRDNMDMLSRRDGGEASSPTHSSDLNRFGSSHPAHYRLPAPYYTTAYPNVYYGPPRKPDGPRHPPPLQDNKSGCWR